MEPPSLNDWDDVSALLEQIISTAPEPFDQMTIANGRDLLSLARTRSPLLDDLAKGYWSTFRFCWPTVEVEVFDDHVETYRDLNGEMDIRHYARTPESDFPVDFLAELPRRVSAD